MGDFMEVCHLGTIQDVKQLLMELLNSWSFNYWLLTNFHSGTNITSSGVTCLSQVKDETLRTRLCLTDSAVTLLFCLSLLWKLFWNAGGVCTRETMTARISLPCSGFLAAHLLYLINSLKDHKKSLNSTWILSLLLTSSPTCSGKLSPAAWLKEAEASKSQWPWEPTTSFHTLKSLPPGVWKLLGYWAVGVSPSLRPSPMGLSGEL